MGSTDSLISKSNRYSSNTLLATENYACCVHLYYFWNTQSFLFYATTPPWSPATPRNFQL